VEAGLSVREIAKSQERSATTVRHWLRRFGLKTRPASERFDDELRQPEMIRECTRHGWTVWVREGSGRYRCKRCRLEAVSARRRRVKEILVAEAAAAAACAATTATPEHWSSITPIRRRRRTDWRAEVWHVR
jgi:hypothetical protein